jgi:hypothetical protein
MYKRKTIESAFCITKYSPTTHKVGAIILIL